MYECTVSELNRYIKDLLDDNTDKIIKLKGELSSVKKSGKNIWLTIKDSMATITCVFWSYDKFDHKEGDQVIITGRVTYYSKSGNVNFMGSQIESVGIGELYKQYQKNYEEFRKKGYFDNKKDLPTSINKIGVLTAKDGAALQDLLYVLKNNNFGGTVYVYNCVVQGNKCPGSIVKGIKYFKENHNDLDVLLLTRGGGSFEDLIGFSDPAVIKAIYNCDFYTISAIGHEVDNMLSDYVANYRAPTPSVAGKVISEQYSVKMQYLNDSKLFLEKSIVNDQNLIKLSLQKLYRLKDKLPDATNSIDWELENLKSIKLHYYNLLKSELTRKLDKAIQLKNRLQEGSHQSILDKGYVLLVNKKGRIVDSKKKLKLKKNKNLKMYLADKELNVKIIINE